MQKKNVSQKLGWVALVGSLFALPCLSLAQPGEGYGHGRGRRGSGGPGDNMRVLRKLDLSDAQRDSVRAIFEEMRATGNMKRVAESRKALNDAVEALADDGEIKDLAFQLGEAEGEAAIERKQMQQKIEDVLTDDQRQKLSEKKAERKAKIEESRKHMEERFERRKHGTPKPL